MLPSRHVVVSISLGVGVGFFTRSAVAGLLCFFSGVLVDLDHIIDYIIRYDFKIFNSKQVYRRCKNFIRPEENYIDEKIYLLLHAVEIAILLWIAFLLTKNIYLLSIAVGYSGHLMLDIIGNDMKPWGYFISVRMKNSFRIIKMVKPSQKQR